MPPTIQSRGRRSDDGKAPQINRKISRESAGSKISLGLHNEEPVKNDAQEGGLFSPNFRAATNGGMKRSILRKSQVDAWQDMAAGLPAEKGFPIQIGSELFRLSGASIMSDGQFAMIYSPSCYHTEGFRAPSYFSKFFEDQLRQNEETGGVRTLYIDRDPATFQDIARHLQGKAVLVPSRELAY